MKTRRVYLYISLASILLLALPAWQGIQPLAARAPAADAQNVEFVGQIGGLTRAVVVQGDYAYIGVGPRLVVVDISAPADPKVAGRTDVLVGVARSVTVAGGYAYVAAGSGGLRVIAVGDPAYPHEVGYCDTSGYAYDQQ